MMCSKTKMCVNHSVTYCTVYSVQPVHHFLWMHSFTSFLQSRIRLGESSCAYMVHLQDGSLEHAAHAWSELGISIW